MTTREADRIIKAGKPVTVRNEVYQETFTATFVRRDKFSLYSSTGGVFDRTELRVVK